MSQILYLLQEIEMTTGKPSGAYKIGKTTQASADERSRQYKAGNPRQVITYLEIEVPDCNAAESMMHVNFNAWNIKAGGGVEWFDLKGKRLAQVVGAYKNVATHVISEAPEVHTLVLPSIHAEQVQQFFWSVFKGIGWVVGVAVSFVMWFALKNLTGNRRLRPRKIQGDEVFLVTLGWSALLVFAIVSKLVR